MFKIYSEMYLPNNSYNNLKKLFSPRLMFLVFAMMMLGKATGQAGYNMPAVISPSPQSAALTKYGDYPMASYTGLPDITIPLHKVVGRKLSMPISLNFHASGRMANEVNGPLGMRWTLNCGGLITRTMKGLPDEWNEVTPFTVDPNAANAPSFDDLYSACPDGKIPGLTFPNLPWYDTEFDIFNYSLPNGKQGHFILKNENGNKIPMIIPYDPLKIEFTKASTTEGYFENITITDIDGTKYIFGKIDASTGNAIENYFEYDLLGGRLRNIPTAWYLTKIISSDATDEISFDYTSHGTTYYNSSQSAIIGDRVRDNSTGLTGNNGDSYEDYIKDYIVQWHVEQDVDPIIRSNRKDNLPTLSNIQFNGGSISLTYNSNQILTELAVKRGTTTYKKIKFNTSKPSTEADIYYLDNLSFYGEDPNLVGEQYNFNYYNQTGYDIWAATRYKDWWGYCKGTTNLLTHQTISTSSYPGLGYPTSQDIGSYNVDRETNEEAKRSGMLKTITYPTGGQTEFIYEGNQYDNGPNISMNYGPGLRIKEIISKPGQGKEIHKTYTYGANEDGRGYLNEYLRPEGFQHSELMITESNVMHFWNYVDPYYNYNLLNEQCGYRSCNYLCDPYITFDLGNDGVKYDVVTEYSIENNIPQQKIQTRYSWGDNGTISDYSVIDYEEPIFHPRKFSEPANAWLTPVLNSKIYYQYSNGQFDPIKKETYTYSGELKDEAWDMPTYLHTNVIYARTQNGQVPPSDYYDAAKLYHSSNCNVYGYGYRRYTTGSQLLSNTKIEEYTPAGVFKTETNTEYEPDYLMVRSEQIQNSKHETIKNEYTYPHDFPGSTLYQQMVQKNIIAPVVEQKFTVNTVPTKKTTTNYFSPFTSMYVPQSIELKIGTHTQETAATFNQYDNKGHILEQQKNNDVKEVYLWGYESTYPVAKILNSTYDIAKTYITQSVLDNPSNDAALRSHLSALRNIPGALVTTYTYKPMIGVTSETDTRGRTTYYEYDGFGRLTVIKDNEGKVLKKICYNFFGQPETCVDCSSGNTTASWQNTNSALRCQQSSCGSTGYQEQEQRDVNPCSGTFNQTRWIVAGYNLSACPQAGCVTITSTNTAATSGFVASYYNTTTFVTYNFTIPSVTSVQTLGTIPAGTYDLTISKLGNSLIFIFQSGCFLGSTMTAAAGSFYNIGVTNLTCNSLSINLNEYAEE